MSMVFAGVLDPPLSKNATYLAPMPGIAKNKPSRGLEFFGG